MDIFGKRSFLFNNNLSNSPNIVSPLSGHSLQINSLCSYKLLILALSLILLGSVLSFLRSNFQLNISHLYFFLELVLIFKNIPIVYCQWVLKIFTRLCYFSVKSL